MLRLLTLAFAIAMLGISSAAASAARAHTFGACGAKADAHRRWAVVFGTEPTLAKAQTTLARVRGKGVAAHIEVESCSAYEVEQNAFMSSAAVGAAVTHWKKAGFPAAKREDS